MRAVGKSSERRCCFPRGNNAGQGDCLLSVGLLVRLLSAYLPLACWVFTDTERAKCYSDKHTAISRLGKPSLIILGAVF